MLDTRAKEAFEKNIKEGNYGYTEELRKFNEKTGDTEVRYDNLPVEDKNKIIDLLEKKQQGTRLEGGKQVKQLSYFVAQTLGKSPNIERSLDIAAWEVVNGPTSYRKTKKFRDKEKNRTDNTSSYRRRDSFFCHPKEPRKVSRYTSRAVGKTKFISRRTTMVRRSCSFL